MAGLGKAKIFGKEVSLADLYASIEFGEVPADLKVGDGTLIRVSVIEFQGELYRIPGLTIIFVNKDSPKNKQKVPDHLKNKDNWPLDTEDCWEVSNDVKIIRLDAYVGSIFETLYDPEVQADYLAGSGSAVGRAGDLIGRAGDLTARGRAGDLVAMGRAHRGGRLVD